MSLVYCRLERTGSNIVKTDQAKRSFQMSKEDFDRQNRLLLLEMPQFYAKRVDYFQPCLQALIRSQVELVDFRSGVELKCATTLDSIKT